MHYGFKVKSLNLFGEISNLTDSTMSISSPPDARHTIWQSGIYTLRGHSLILECRAM